MSAYQSRANTFFLFFHKYLHVAFTIFQVLGCLFNGTVALDVQIITVINSDNPFYGYSASAPVFEVAFVKMQELYPRAFANVSRYALYSTSKVTCPDGALTVPLISHNISEILAGSPSTGLSVLFCPGCSLEITVLGDFAREWNVPLFSSLGSDPSLADKRRYPTVTTFPTVDHRSISIAVQLFLRKHRWRIVSILCDSLSQFGALSTFYVISCNTIKRKLDAAVGDFQLHLVPFDSKSNIANDYFTVLRKVQQLSRVVIIVTLPAFVRSIMVAAHRLNMTDGSYVYISSQTTQVPTLGSFTWQNSDVDDEEAYEGFRSVIEVVNPNPDWEKITDIIDLISDTTRAKFNRSMKGDQRFNDLAISVYEAYEVFAAVLNESYDEVERGGVSGWKFAQRFRNRRFEYPARPVILNDKGLRMNDVQFFRMEPANGSLLETWRYEVITDRLSVTRPTLAALWVNPTGNPPPDIPRCGFRNDLCYDVASKTTVAASVTAACLLIIVSGLLLSIKFVHARAYDTANQSWWIIDSEKFGRLEGRKRTGNPSFRPSLMPVMQGNPTTCSVSGETF